MNPRRRKNNRPILYHYLITYFVVLFIPLIICCSYYINVISVINKDDIQTQKAELQHTAELIDTMMGEFSYIGDSLAGNVEVNSFRHVEDPFQYSQAYRINELQHSMPNLYQMNQALFDYYVFFDKSKMVINSHMAYSYRDFYDLYLRERDSESYEEWYDKISSKLTYGLYASEEWIYKNDENKRMLMYVRPLLYNLENIDRSFVIIFIEEEKLKTMMPVMSKTDIQYIADRKGTILYYGSGQEADLNKNMVSGQVEEALEISSKQEITDKGIILDGAVDISNGKYYAMCYESQKSGLRYYTLKSEEAINHRRVVSTIKVTGCVALAVAIGMILSYYMSLKSATPISDILKEMSLTKSGIGNLSQEFPSLKTTFNYMASTNRNLIEAIEKQKPYLKNAFINRLLFESFPTQEEAEKMARWMGMEYKDQLFSTIIFRITMTVSDLTDQEFVIASSCIFSLMEAIEVVIPNALCTNIGDEQVVLLVQKSTDDQSVFCKLVENDIERVYSELPEGVKGSLTLYGGKIVNKLVDIKESYNSASCIVLKEKEQIDRPILWYTNSNGNIPKYPSSDLEMKLSYYVTAGDEKGLHDELEEIMNTYIIHNNLSPYLQHMLLNELQIVLFRLLGRLDIGEEEYQKYYDKLEDSHGAAWVVQLSNTLNSFRDICKYVAGLKSSVALEGMIPSIVSYIDTNYGDGSLSLTNVADLFHISEPYLSSVFKQSMGINFSNYVERVRINKAKEFLETTTMPINEIAEKVGYYSTNSFCRAFKRVTGVNASAYRNQ